MTSGEVNVPSRGILNGLRRNAWTRLTIVSFDLGTRPASPPLASPQIPAAGFAVHPISRSEPTSSKSSVPQSKTKAKAKAADVSKFAVSAERRDRPKRFKLDDWAHVPAKVLACWPDEGNVTVELPDGQRYTVS
jgi:hypothetical protein